ncbi:NAD(P)-dependent dehydrogenase (short-subunit alcohol dehydrogenase family) [Evansella vedderi]|uniref:NAD(P)-dependent dehydrogenase (Short-subunit alcohol dehydrogenase family) n=1 Tax=Evansella vedderi TaxID=38282 RepID=A0ABT9ZV80_9BACI|nr:SDR family NAD(P)-dependent oxidoreductase [Evansella vedderi]MDQ0255148.1 NAD(P)-dependent dehydrogenase (short-subunit alcohol dehydrogenase family) [Evansella vedderi]
MVQSKVAVISGGGSGIGKGAALELAKSGYKICIMDLKENRAEHVKEKIVNSGGEAIVLDIDVKDEERVRNGFQQAIEKFGSVDTVFINAGINGTLSAIEELEIKDWDQTIDTNLKSTFLFIKQSIPHMKSKGGSIIITSSINGNRTFSNIGMSAYSTSKAGQVAFMKMAALELARYKIRVNAICPGAIKTNIGQNTSPKDNLDEVKIPVKYPEGNQPLEHGPGTPEQVAQLVSFLASDASSHITGTEIYIDGAESLL